MERYAFNKRLMWVFVAIAIGILIAGFWNYKLIDGIGRDWIAEPLMGDPESVTFKDKGTLFGLVFAAAVGLAASFTACNCVVFAMLPSLACSTDRETTRKKALKTLGVFAIGVLTVCAAYGIYVISLGEEGVRAFNERGIRISQAQTTFTWIGVFLLAWGMLSFGFFNRITTLIHSRVLSLLQSPYTKALLMGLMSGFFTVGRPYPIFRSFLLYASESGNIWFGSLVMMVQGLGQIAVMVLFYVLIIGFFGKRLNRWVQMKPHQPVLISSFALLVGGAFFIYYWGFSFWYDIGQWGFKLGWYR